MVRSWKCKGWSASLSKLDRSDSYAACISKISAGPGALARLGQKAV